MKKLLVTAIGAAAALGAFAANEISLLRFEDMERGGTTISDLNTHATYWSADADATNNTYAIEERVGTIVSRQTAIEIAPTNALSIKTTFGKPLSVNVVDGGSPTNIPSSGIYFDSLVKFTVCEDEPVVTNYDGAKIVMWLQEQYTGDEITATNLVVAAGYLTGASITNSTKVYVCGNEIAGDFAEKFHRVTIKAIADITNGQGIPGFAIYIDGNDTTSEFGLRANCSDAKWDADFTYALTEAAQALANANALFPSMIQQGGAIGKLTAASFDGTGSLTDIIFTDNAPTFAQDYVSEKVGITVNGNPLSPFTSYEAAVTYVNSSEVTSADTVELVFLKGMTIDGTLAFESAADVTLDFAGVVITNESASAAAISNNGKLTITNSTVAVGGVYCADAGAAVVNGAMSEYTDIMAGCFWGAVVEQGLGTLQLFGGSYSANTMTGSLAAGKMFSEQGATYPGLYDVVDYVAPTYTVTFVSGIDGQITNAYDNLASGAEMPTAPDASVAGWNYVWVPSPIDSVVTSNATYTAQYTAINYEIKFVYGLEKEETNTVSATYYQSVSVPVDSTNIVGYTVAWTPEIANGAVTVTHDQTYEATYTPIPYTITFVAEGGTVDPASTNYTIESGAITLPSAVHNGGLGLQFDGWTNATMTITTADLTFTPTAANLGDFTLYAKWTAGGPTYPTYLDNATAEVKAKYLTWAGTYGTDDSSQYEAAFLLNVAPNGDTTLDATAVTISGTTVTIAIDHANVNGYPYVKKAATVAGLASAPKTQVTIVPADNIDNGGVVTLTGESGDAQFYQIGVQAEAINQN